MRMGEVAYVEQLFGELRTDVAYMEHAALRGLRILQEYTFLTMAMEMPFWKAYAQSKDDLVSSLRDQLGQTFFEKQGQLEFACPVPDTHYFLYRKENGVGGYTYYSDEIGGGVFVWDTCLVGDVTLQAALDYEKYGSPAYSKSVE